MTRSARLLYLSAQLPKRSETFVYREMLALRDSGIDIVTASVHLPERDLDDARLDALADETLCIYERKGQLLCTAVLESLLHPKNSLVTVAMAVSDAIYATDIGIIARIKLLFHCLAG